MVDKYDYEVVNLFLWVRWFMYVVFIDIVLEIVC